MQLLITTFLLLITSSMISSDIPKSLREYIENKKRLQKYSVKKYVDYEKNQTSFVEESIYLNAKNTIPITDHTYFNDKVLNVSVYHRDGYEFDCNITRDRNNELVIEGFSIDLLQILRDVLHFQVRFHVSEYKKNDDKFILEFALLNNYTADLILCHPEGNNTWTEVLHPTLKSKYIIIYRPSKLSFTEDIFILTFAGTLWLCFIILMILLALALRLTSKQYHRIYGHPEWNSVEITFWALVTSCQQGLSSDPHGFSSRLIVFLGSMSAYLLYTGFAAGITSLVAVQNQNVEITIADIEKMKLNVVSFGDLNDLPAKYNYLKNSWNAPNMDKFFDQLNEKHWIGVTLQILLDQYMIKQGKRINECLYVMKLIPESEHIMSNLVPKGSAYKKIFNYWLLRNLEPAISTSTALENRFKNTECYSSSGYSSAKLEHVESAIAVLLVGLLISFVFMIGECVWDGYLHRKERRRSAAPWE